MPFRRQCLVTMQCTRGAVFLRFRDNRNRPVVLMLDHSGWFRLSPRLVWEELFPVFDAPMQNLLLQKTKAGACAGLLRESIGKENFARNR